MKMCLVALLLLCAGCSTSPGFAESEREVVLQYVQADVGTVGPFAKKAKRELDVLAEKDRTQALALLDRGAVAFLVFPKTPSPGAPPAPTPAVVKPGETRMILVQHGRVVADFKVP